MNMLDKAWCHFWTGLHMLPFLDNPDVDSPSLTIHVALLSPNAFTFQRWECHGLPKGPPEDYVGGALDSVSLNSN